MLSKQVTKIVQNLEKKKFREKYNLFKIEGEKLVGELLHSPLKIHSLIAFPSWLEQNKKALSNVNIIEADEREMHGISNFQSLPEVIALAEIPVHIYRKEEVLDSLSLVLNGIRVIWVPSSGWQTGSESETYSVMPIVPVFIIPNVYKPAWGPSSGSRRSIRISLFY